MPQIPDALLEFETPRFIVRKMTVDDVDDSYEFNSHPEVTRYISGESDLTKDDIRNMIVNRVQADYDKYGYGRMSIVWKANNKMIGFTGLKYVEELDEVDIGYRLNYDYWGKGIATESSLPFIAYGFETLGLQKIIAAAEHENKGSFHVMKKLGMQFERDINFEGDDMAIYAITRAQYEAGKRE